MARAVAVAGVALASLLALSAPAHGAPASTFREVAVDNGFWAVQSDGVRFAWVQPRSYAGAVRVFDTLRGRNFRLAPPRPECSFGGIGGGLAVSSCYDEPRRVFLTDLSTGRRREPVGIDQVWPKAFSGASCHTLGDVGRYWLGFACGNGFGPGDEPFYLNHRTGRLIPEFDPYVSELPFIDADYVDLFRPYCAPLERPPDGSRAPPYFDYAPPFALHAPLGTGAAGRDGDSDRLDPLAALWQRARGDPQPLSVDRLSNASARQRLRDVGRTQTRIRLPPEHPAPSAGWPCAGRLLAGTQQAQRRAYLHPHLCSVGIQRLRRALRAA